jgi:hypothetical protein
VFAGTWNVGGVVPPDDLDLKDWLDTTAGSCDIYVLGYFLIADPFDSEQCCRQVVLVAVQFMMLTNVL